MPPRKTYSKRGRSSRRNLRGYRRGTYEWKVENLNCQLRKGTAVSEVFARGGFKWQLSLHCDSHSCSPQKVHIRLLSCNRDEVHAHVRLTIVRPKNLKGGVQWRPKAALPFSVIDRQSILFEQLLNSGKTHSIDRLVIVAELKNISDADDEQRENGSQATPISVEVIEGNSIKEHLNNNEIFGVGPGIRERHGDVYSSSLTRVWAESNPDHRYWLCEQLEEGNILVKRCLDSSPLSETFQDVLEETSEFGSTVTVFKETKKSSQMFPPIEEDTVIVFAKLYEPGFEDLSFLGTVHIQKTVSGLELPMKVFQDLASFLVEDGVDAFLEEEKGSIKDITSEKSSLQMCGVHSGSVVIIRKRVADEKAKVEDVQNELCRIDKHEYEASRASWFAWSRQSFRELCSFDWQIFPDNPLFSLSRNISHEEKAPPRANLAPSFRRLRTGSLALPCANLAASFRRLRTSSLAGGTSLPFVYKVLMTAAGAVVACILLKWCMVLALIFGLVAVFFGV